MKKPLHIVVALGFTSTAGQVLLMRELIVVFYGNELSLGIMLGGWLFWVGAGSLAAAWVIPRFASAGKTWALAALQAALGVATVGALLSVRALPLMLKRASAGEIVGYTPIVLSSFLVLAPMCLLLGFLFDAYCHAWSKGEDAAASIGSVYIFEALGAGLGGVVFAWVLVRTLDPSQIASVLLLLNLLSCVATLALERKLRVTAVAVSAITIIVAASTYFGGAAWLRQTSLGWLWQELDIVHSEDSIYGNIAFAEKEEQKSLYENGLLMFSYPNRFSAEEAVHFALLEHPAPKGVLLIGGGVSGSLNEVLKHPVERVDYVELDPLVIEMVGRFFPPEVSAAIEDPRVGVHNVDGRLFVKTRDTTYDAIILDLPDPYTSLINRFYTLEFFRECEARLASDGILSFRVSSAENYISPELQQFLGCLYRTLEEVFPDIKVVPGESNIFLACRKPGVLTLDADELSARLEERGIKDELQFIREYYLPHRLSEERKERLAAALSTTDAKLNMDLAPTCYYYDAILWSKQFGETSGRILSFFARTHAYWIPGIIGGLFVLLFLIQRIFSRAWGSKSILVAVGTTGFAEIAIEVVTLLGFQATYGYVYYKVAIIITTFMLGLTIGAVVMRRGVASGAGRKTFLFIQGLVCLYPLLLIGALMVFSRGGTPALSTFMSLLQTHAAFPLMAFLAGFVGGLQFPLANALMLASMPSTARVAGYTYGIDLLGSCLGAILTTALLIPVFGIPYACAIASLLNLGSFLLVSTQRSPG
jgi:spermidine synthase